MPNGMEIFVKVLICFVSFKLVGLSLLNVIALTENLNFR